MRMLENKQRRNQLIALAFLLPNLIGFLCFTAGPVALSLFMSFTNWSLKPAIDLEWVGLRNYADILTSQTFWFYLYNTLYMMIGIPFTVGGSLLLANVLASPLLLKERRNRLKLALLVGAVGIVTTFLLFGTGHKDTALILGMLYLAGVCGILWGSMTYRTMLYVPSFASGVASIILWTQIFNPYHGLANQLLGQFSSTFGLDGDLPTWLVSTKSLLGFLPLPESFNNGGFGIGAREAILIMSFWMGVGGNNMILYIAAISNIPEDLYEAAEIDGANSAGRFRHITIPQVAPTTFFISIMAVIGGLQGGFEYARIMTQGGPAGHTTTLAYYVYTAGFEELQLGFASSVSWVIFLLVFGLTLTNWKYGNRGTDL